MSVLADVGFHLFDRADGSIDINSKNKDDLTFLHLACKMGGEDLVNYLIDKSADVNAVYVDKVGTSLQFSAWSTSSS